MTLRLYDSRAQTTRDFTPIVPGEVGVYVCGPTVQSSPHIGHLRSALVYDQLRRWLTFSGYRVTLVRNVTDIDDKVLANATQHEPWWALAYRMELEFSASYRALNIAEPTYEPRATASIQQMHDIIARLISAGHAYQAEDGSADVYFDVRSWPAYGALTRQNLDDLDTAGDADSRGKRDPADFALWKSRKEDEPSSAQWPSPWGEGRPGWHIECSAMSSRYLGPHFDIHGGGLDLRFPHHENELAQSTAAGDAFANYWVHNGLVNVNGNKMSKSLGNSVFAAELLAAARPIVVRYFLGQAHYRSTVDFHSGALAEAEAALNRIETFLERASRRLGSDPSAISEAALPTDAFRTAMDDDLAIPQALAAVHETVRSGNIALEADDIEGVARSFQQITAMTDILGINPLAPEWRNGSHTTADAVLGRLVDTLIVDRATARDARDFATADRIRDALASAGIIVEDTASGAHWSIDGQ